MTRLQAACGTSQTNVLNLGNWSVVQYGPYGQGPANWVLSANNTVVDQVINADASILVGPQVLQNDQIQGSWRVDDKNNGDDDFMGFVFGYQDDQHFYLFDWKAADQTISPGVFAERGMCIKAVTAPSALTESDLYPTASLDNSRVRLLYHNTIPWVNRTDYQFNLQLQPGHFIVTVRQGATVLATISIFDNTYASGRFGFYNYSQGNVQYSGFAQNTLPPIPLITAANRSVAEGNTGTTPLNFSVNLSVSNCVPTTVDYFLTPGTATSGIDYTASPSSGTLTFLAGQTNKIVSVTVLGDTTIEPDETLFLTLTNAVGGTIGTTQAVGTIINDDSNRTPVCSLNPPGPFTVTPGTPVNFTLTGSDPDPLDLITLTAGPLPSGASMSPALPFVGTSSSFSWTPTGTQIGSFPISFSVADDSGAQSQCGTTITVQPVADLAISKSASPSALVIGGTISYSIGITNLGPSASAGVVVTDTLPTNLNNVVFNPSQGSCTVAGNIVSCTLGTMPAGGNATVVITATPSSQGAIFNSVSVAGYSSDPVASNNTASASVIVTNIAPSVGLALTSNPCLLLPTNLTLLAGAGDPDGAVVRVEFYDDTTKLGEKLTAPFSIVWSNVPPGPHLLTAVAWDNSGASVTSAPVAITASLPSALSIDDQIVVEGNTSTSAVFTVTLAPPSCRAVTVQVVTADGTALAGSDYMAVSTGVTFLPGQTQMTVTVPITGDTQVEPDETFLICLTNALNATLSRACGLGTIINDDTNSDLAITKSATPSTLNIGGVVSYTIGVVNHGPSAAPDVVVVDMLPAGLSNLVITSSQGSCSRTDDTITCALGTLANGATATIGINAAVTTQGTLINSASVSGNSPDSVPGNNTASATVSVLNLAPSVALTLPLANPCLTLPTNLTITAAASDPDGTITRVEFYDDATKLGELTAPPFTILWTNMPSGPHLLTAVALDNSGISVTSAPVAVSGTFPSMLSLDDRTVIEANTTMTFTIMLTPSSCRTVTVDVATSDGTATAGSDYAAAAASLVFLPGETLKTLVVPILGDTRVEPDETFLVCLTNVSGATVSKACGLGTILNDDYNGPPVVSIIDPVEGANFYTPPGIVPIEAEAHDSDGYVQRVDFFVGTTFIGSSTNGPWTVRWTNSVQGPYVLTAVATDDGGAKGTSAPVHIVLQHCAPDVTASPLANQVRCICDEVYFTTTVAISEPVSFVWKANGIVIPGETTNTLHLQNLKPNMAGTYSVEVSSACASITRSATLTLKGTGGLNPVPFTNSGAITIPLSGIASPYPSSISVECVPGLLKHVSVTLDGLSHSSPDDVDVLLVGPGNQAIKLMSDCGGFTSQKLTNVVLTFTDTATTALPDSTRIFTGVYRPTDYGATDPFLAPAPQGAASGDFSSLLMTDPNGTWSLYVVDDTGGDSGSIARGWYLSLEWDDAPPRLSAPVLRSDGRFQTTLEGIRHMGHMVEASSDLTHWTPVSTNTPSASATIILDPGNAGMPYRFYRAVRCP